MDDLEKEMVRVIQVEPNDLTIMDSNKILEYLISFNAFLKQAETEKREAVDKDALERYDNRIKDLLNEREKLDKFYDYIILQQQYLRQYYSALIDKNNKLHH